MINKKLAIEMLEKINAILYNDSWRSNLIQYIKRQKIQIFLFNFENNNDTDYFEKSKMIAIFERLLYFESKNYLFLAKRVVEEEINNLKGITPIKCKKRKIKEEYCELCSNLNCSLNAKKTEES